MLLRGRDERIPLTEAYAIALSVHSRTESLGELSLDRLKIVALHVDLHHGQVQRLTEDRGLKEEFER